MIYRNDPYLDAQFQKAVQAAHNQDWDTFEHSSFYDARMMEDLLYVCEDFMPLEARIIRPENWRDALPESVRDLDTFTIYRGSSSDISRAPLSLSWSLSYDVAEWFARRNNFLYQLPVHVYQATIKADKIIAYLNYRNEFEVLQYRNIKDVQEITPLRGYSSLYNAFLKSQSTPGSDSDAGDRYFNEWYQAQGK